MASDKAEDIYSFSSPGEQDLFSKIVHELRCSVCQNQSLSDSVVPLAVDLKNEIYQKVRSQHSEQQIIEFVTNRYGNFVLYEPPKQWDTVFLWYSPLIILVFGLFIIVKQVRFK